MARKFGPFDTSQFYEVENRRMQRAFNPRSGFVRAGQGAVTAGTGPHLVIAAYPDGALIDGIYVENPAPETVPLWTNSSSLPRADRLVLRLDMNARKIEPLHLQGTPSGNPQPPALVQTATLYDLPLCRFIMPGSGSAQNPTSIADERIVAGGWTTFTPMLVSAGQQPVMKAENRIGRYRWLDSATVHCEMQFRWTSLGTGEGYGTGIYGFSLPVAPASWYPDGFVVGVGNYSDVGTSPYPGTAILAPGNIVHLVAAISSDRIGADRPVVPANGDSYTLSLTYEAA